MPRTSLVNCSPKVITNIEKYEMEQRSGIASIAPSMNYVTPAVPSYENRNEDKYKNVIDMLVDALNFYANESNYKSAIKNDVGKIARNTLEHIKEFGF